MRTSVESSWEAERKFKAAGARAAYSNVVVQYAIPLETKLHSNEH